MQLVTGFNDVKKSLGSRENLRKFLEHVNVYEADVPKYLIKK